MIHFFYGEECPHCHDMMPIVDKMIAEGIEIKKFETWHNRENAQKYAGMKCGSCNGVPLFVNTQTGLWICGATSEERMRKLASGKNMDV
jgi:thiol-disulfide isomerase/thioredoxin